jgi:hypothetical protein
MNSKNVKGKIGSTVVREGKTKTDVSRMIKIIKMGKEIRRIDGPKFYGNTIYGC